MKLAITPSNQKIINSTLSVVLIVAVAVYMTLVIIDATKLAGPVTATVDGPFNIYQMAKWQAGNHYEATISFYPGAFLYIATAAAIAAAASFARIKLAK